jgi:hypothetical protein
MVDGTLLHRQINQAFLDRDDADVVGHVAFRPFPRDDGELSVYDGDMISPRDSWVHYTSELHLKSVGVQSVTVSECSSASLAARAAPEPFPEHAVIDFGRLSKSEMTSKAKTLRNAAAARGWLHRASVG